MEEDSYEQILNILDILKLIFTSAGAVFASSWIYRAIKRRRSAKKNNNHLILQMAQLLIYERGSHCCERGHISYDEYECMNELYKMYSELGGNGLAEHIMNKVKRLPMRRLEDIEQQDRQNRRADCISSDADETAGAVSDRTRDNGERSDNNDQG